MNPRRARWRAGMYAQKINIDVFSARFVWAPEHQRKRLYLDNIYDDFNVLEIVLRSALSDDERRTLFPGPFDLGSPEPLRPQDCTPFAFEAVIRDMSLPERDGGLKSMRDGFARVTHHRFDDYCADDPSKAYRVAVLLYRFATKHSHLFSHLQTPAPGDLGSLELNNPYQYGHQGELRWDLLDLRSLLAAEIPPERRDEIDRTFRRIRQALDTFLDEITLGLRRDLSSVDEAVRRYEVVAGDWVGPSPPASQTRLPADEQLYTHFWVLDFVHYVRTEQRLVREQHQPYAIASLWPELRRAAPIALAELEEKPVFVRLQEWINLAIGQQFSAKEFTIRLKDVPVLLEHYHLRPLPQLPAEFLPEQVLAALIFAAEIRHPSASALRVYMPGEGSEARSVKSALRQGVSQRAEEFERVCHYGIDRICDALRGQQPLHQVRQSFSLRLAEKVVGLLQTHDTKRVRYLMDTLYNYPKHALDHVIVRARQAAA